FWEKEIAERGSRSWRFVPTGLPLRGHPLANPTADGSVRALGPAEDLRYLARRADASIEVPDFNPYCSPSRLRVSFGRGVMADLASRGATGLIDGRSDERLEDAAEEIGAARSYRADLASLEQVRAMARAVLDSEERIDALVNNAGLGGTLPGDGRRMESEDGL